MFPTAVNSQVTDSVTQANTIVVGTAPAEALSNFYVANSQALSNAAHNATANQQNSNVVGGSATTTGVATLYAIDTASLAKGTRRIFG